MEQYLLVIYDEILTGYEIDTLSHLCGGAKIEPLSKGAEASLIAAFQVTCWNTARYAYRFYWNGSDVLPPIALIGKIPLYLARLNFEIEKKRYTYGYHYEILQELKDSLDCLYDDIINGILKIDMANSFEVKVNTDILEEFIREFEENLESIISIINVQLLENRLT